MIHLAHQPLPLGWQLQAGGYCMDFSVKISQPASLPEDLPGFPKQYFRHCDAMDALVNQPIMLVNANNFSHRGGGQTGCMDQPSQASLIFNCVPGKPIMEQFENLPILPGINICGTTACNGGSNIQTVTLSQSVLLPGSQYAD